MLQQFKKCEKDPERFENWMKDSCRANSHHVKKVYCVVKQLDVDTAKNTNIMILPSKSKHHIMPALFYFYLLQTNICNQFSPHLIAIRSPIMFYHLQVSPVNALTGFNNNDLMMMEPREHFDDHNDDDCVSDDTDAIKEQLSKMQHHFLHSFNVANNKMSELQSELGKMQRISYEFDSLAKFLKSSEQISNYGQNLSQIQKKMLKIEGSMLQLSANNRKLGRAMKQLTENAKQDREHQEKSIKNIAAGLSRFENKLNVLANQMPHQNKKRGEPDDFSRFKCDIENILNGRLQDILSQVEKQNTGIKPMMVIGAVLSMAVFNFLIGNVFDKFLMRISSFVSTAIGFGTKERK